eukprot:2410726-Rhodomonas_salina.2
MGDDDEVWSYALHMRSLVAGPVLKYPCSTTAYRPTYLLFGTDRVRAVTRFRRRVTSSSTTSSRVTWHRRPAATRSVCYAISGTDIDYDATRFPVST